LRIRQYVYFSAASTQLDPDAMTARFGVAPDEVSVRGSKRSEPPLPVSHRWELHADGEGRIDDQLTALVARLRPLLHVIKQMIAEGHRCGLQVVRELGEGEPESHPATGDLVVISGQHQLLGWHLDRDLIAFLAETGMELDIDEYG
jgi:hypothetical protein